MSTNSQEELKELRDSFTDLAVYLVDKQTGLKKTKELWNRVLDKNLEEFDNFSRLTVEKLQQLQTDLNAKLEEEKMTRLLGFERMKKELNEIQTEVVVFVLKEL
jgi:hypothetical protein